MDQDSVKFKILYPESRTVNASWINTQYDDSVTNGKCKAGIDNVIERANELHREGIITLEQGATT
jgi:hypothetical protein